MEYAPGLHVNWTAKELAKIAEIKSREKRQHYSLLPIPWDGHEEMVKLEKKQKKIKAIKLLDECGISTIIIAEIFDTYPARIRQILKR